MATATTAIITVTIILAATIMVAVITEVITTTIPTPTEVLHHRLLPGIRHLHHMTVVHQPVTVHLMEVLRIAVRQPVTVHPTAVLRMAALHPLPKAVLHREAA